MKGKIVSQLHTGIVFIEAEDGTEYIFFWKEAEGYKIKKGRTVRFTPGEPKDGGKYPWAYSVVVEKTFSDFARVVRCRDCKHWTENLGGQCNKFTVNGIAHCTSPDWFCADGEIVET